MPRKPGNRPAGGGVRERKHWVSPIGQLVERKPYDAVYQQRDPRTGQRLGRPRGQYAKFADHLAQLKAAEPHATAERLIELEREAAQATRQPAAYTDVTVSFSKSISVLHASIQENARRARLVEDQQAAGLLGRTGGEVPGDLCTGPTGPRWSTCRPGPGSPAPAITVSGSTGRSRAGSRKRG